MAVHQVELSCETCKRKTPHRFEYPSDDFANMAMCAVCESLREISIEVRNQLPGVAEQEALAAAQLVQLTTAPSLAGYEIAETIEIITAESVMGMSMFADFFASVRDLVGGRSKAIQESLREARRNCLAELRKEAAALDANAVIGVSLNYSEISGGGKSMLFLVATGTAVRVVSIQDLMADEDAAPQ